MSLALPGEFPGMEGGHVAGRSAKGMVLHAVDRAPVAEVDYARRGVAVDALRAELCESISRLTMSQLIEVNSVVTAMTTAEEEARNA